MTKILISVLSSLSDFYPDLERGIRNTWLKTNNGSDVIFYYGSGSNKYLDGDRLFLESEETFENVALKTVLMYEYVLDNFEFDYVFRTNLSSFVNIPKLCEYASDKPKKEFYSAIIGNHEGIEFASGSGYFISNDLVELVVNNKKNIDYSLIDDVAIGKLMMDNKIKPKSGIRKDFNESNIGLISKSDIDTYYHFRCKCADRKNDVVIFEKLFSLV